MLDRHKMSMDVEFFVLNPGGVTVTFEGLVSVTLGVQGPSVTLPLQTTAPPSPSVGLHPSRCGMNTRLMMTPLPAAAAAAAGLFACCLSMFLLQLLAPDSRRPMRPPLQHLRPFSFVQELPPP
jgi:hypothetical protein